MSAASRNFPPPESELYSRVHPERSNSRTDWLFHVAPLLTSTMAVARCQMWRFMPRNPELTRARRSHRLVPALLRYSTSSPHWAKVAATRTEVTGLGFQVCKTRTICHAGAEPSLKVHRSSASFGSNARLDGVTESRFATYSPLSDAALRRSGEPNECVGSLLRRLRERKRELVDQAD